MDDEKRPLLDGTNSAENSSENLNTCVILPRCCHTQLTSRKKTDNSYWCEQSCYVCYSRRPSVRRGYGTSSPNLVILVFFLAVLIDCMLMTVVDPILPAIMVDIGRHPDRLISDRFLDPPLNMSGTSNLTEEYSTKIAVLVGLKPGLEVFFNIAVGFLVDRIGHQIPMISGCVFNLVASVGFAYLRNYPLLIAARAFQAFGSSLTVVGGLAMIAASFPDEKERSVAMGKSLTGVGLGLAGGFALGSILYEFCGLQSPFFVIAFLNIIDGVMRLLIISPEKSGREGVGLKYAKNLLLDKKIFAGLLMNLVENMAIGIFLGIGPAWMVYTLKGRQWIVGAILSMAAVIQVCSQYAISRISVKFGQWKCVLIGFLVIAAGMACYPFCHSIWEVMGPQAVTRLGHGLLMACINPVLCKLVDLRHDSRYGLINGFYTATYNIGLSLGTNVGGLLIKAMSFDRLYWVTSSLVGMFSLIALFWRDLGPPSPLPSPPQSPPLLPPKDNKTDERRPLVTDT